MILSVSHITSLSALEQRIQSHDTNAAEERQVPKEERSSVVVAVQFDKMGLKDTLELQTKAGC